MKIQLHKQKGSTLVEMAIVLLLFLMVILAIMEFSIATYRSAQLWDATRYGVRYAIVNDPVGELPTCPGGISTPVDASVEMKNGMANLAPIINSQSGIIAVEVEYACPATGSNIGTDDIYLVTVSLSGAKHFLTVPGVLGLNAAIGYPDFKSTRLSEDLHTPVVDE